MAISPVPTPGVTREVSANGYEHDYPDPLPSIEKVGYLLQVIHSIRFETECTG